jgi:hypothetical protein
MLQRLEIRSFPARSGDKIRELQLMDDVYMNYCFQRLVMEAKKQKGDDYPSKLLRNQNNVSEWSAMSTRLKIIEGI